MVKSKGYLIICFILIVGVLITIGINNVDNNSNPNILGKNIKEENAIIKNNNQSYILYDVIKSNIDADIYFDEISSKVIITGNGEITKYKTNENKKSIGIGKNAKEVETNIQFVIKQDKKVYINLEEIVNLYKLNYTVVNKKIYIYRLENKRYNSLKNNTHVYSFPNNKSKISKIVSKNIELIKICEESALKTNGYIKVTGVDKTNKSFIGYVYESELKLLDNISENTNNNVEINNGDKNIMYNLNIQDINDLTRNNTSSKIFVASDVFKLDETGQQIINTQVKIKEKFTTILANKKYCSLAIINNGYLDSNYSNTVFERVLLSEALREKLIINIVDNVENYGLNGIVIDFKSTKSENSEYFTQYIKELCTIMKQKNKIVVLNLYKNDLNDKIANIEYVDFVNIKAYGYRDLDSSISGADSTIKNIESTLNEVLSNEVALKQENKNKIIVEIPMQSYLWVEKNTKVINAEEYSIKAQKEYIKKNNLKIKHDEKTDTNYTELKKGELVYKMWLEDEYLITKKINLFKDKKINNISINKKENETKEVLNIVLSFIK